MNKKLIMKMIGCVFVLCLIVSDGLNSADGLIKSEYLVEYSSYPECNVTHDEICEWDKSKERESIDSLMFQRYHNDCFLIELGRCWLSERERGNQNVFAESNYIRTIAKENDKISNGEIAYIIRNVPYLSASFYDLVFEIDRSEYFQYYESLLYSPSVEVDGYAKDQLVMVFSDTKTELISEFILFGWGKFPRETYPGEYSDIFNCMHCNSNNKGCSDIIVLNALHADNTRNVSSKMRHAFPEFSVANCLFPPVSPVG